MAQVGAENELPRMKGSDWTDMTAIAAEMDAAAKALEAMAEDVGRARTVAEYDGDRRKRCLSVATTAWLNMGESAIAAEHKGRASDEYGKVMKQLRAELEMAETVKARWTAAQAKFDAARSRFSFQGKLVQL